MIFDAFKKLDWLVLLPVLALGLLGLLNLYFLGPSIGYDFFYKQVVFWLIGLGLVFALSFFNWELLKNYSLALVSLYLAALGALVAVFFLGTTVRGVVSWIDIGPFVFQPSEFAKIVLVIILAKYFSWRHIELYRLRHVLISAFYFLLLTAPILLQPDLGTAIIFAGVWMSILFLSGMPLRHLGLVLLAGLILAGFAWGFVLAPYQKDRVLSFFVPSQDPLGANYARTQSLIAVGSGRLIGKDFSGFSQGQLGYIPEPHTDFAFAVLAENLGFLGSIFILLVLSTLIGRLFWFAIAVHRNRQLANFSRLFAGGFAALLAIQVIINIGMNLGLLPITGISLPFISYGGSGLLAMLIGVGVYQGMHRAMQ